MILVTTGSSDVPFDRLIDAVDALRTGEEIVVQHGPSAIRPTGATCVDYVSFGELSQLVDAARVVVAHAGVGSILLCLSRGVSPLVVPRLPSLGEVVDDHQLVLARRLAHSGTVVCVEDLSDLPALVRAKERNVGRPKLQEGGALALELRTYVDSVLRERKPVASAC